MTPPPPPRRRGDDDLAFAATMPGGPAPPTAALTAEGAVHAQGVARVRAFGRAVNVLALLSVAVIPFVGGDTTAKVIAIASVLLGVGYYSVLLRFLGDLSVLTPGRIAWLTLGSMPATWGGLYYFGPLSPFGMVVGLAVYLHALVLGPLRYTLPACLGLALGHVTLGALTLLGVLPDVGLVPASSVPPVPAGLTLAAVAASYAVAFVLGRSAHASAIQSSIEFEAAARAVAVQHALLEEARQELNSAVGAGGPGRLTNTVCGRWRLGHLLGRGSMGEVYDASHIETGAEAAVKVLHPEVLGDERYAARFRQEAETTAALDSPHVVDVIETGDADDGAPFIAMERLVGRDLADHLRDTGPLPLLEVVTLVTEVARGLEAARAAGLVHRDLKPHNLFLADLPGGARAWKILDFGIAEVVGQDNTVTRDGVVGTPGYMAPEQVRGAPVDHRADVYSLSAIAYRALTGHPPFPGTRAIDVLQDVLTVMPARPRTHADVPAAVESILALGLAKRAQDRFSRALGLADAVAQAARGQLDPRLHDHAEAVLAVTPWR